MTTINIRGNGTCHINDDAAQENPAINHYTQFVYFYFIKKYSCQNCFNILVCKKTTLLLSEIQRVAGDCCSPVDSVIISRMQKTRFLTDCAAIQ